MSFNQAEKFKSPPSFEREVKLHSGKIVKGMGIAPGIHLVVGGGFHGKTTVLKALEVGVYNKIPGDGREFVVAIPETVKIRAEDGRRVSSVDISPFINNLPRGLSTKSFSTDDASGSTSQATNIMEALECGARCLLIDEDQSATNFMIRDQRMQQLVTKSKEPITPFRFKVRQLLDELKVSTILVIGGSGDYFEVADTVTVMESYIPKDATSETKQLIANSPSSIQEEGGHSFGGLTPRALLSVGEPRREKVATKFLVQWKDGEGDDLDLSAVGQLVEDGQTRTIVDCLHLIRNRYCSAPQNQKPFSEMLDEIEREFELQNRMHFLCGKDGPGTLSRPRKFEIACAFNRYRSSSFETIPPK